MKKFLVYVVVIVTLLFLGFTVYYIAMNDEEISLTIKSGESIYMNVGDDPMALPIKWTNASKGTKLSISGADGSVLKYDESSKKFMPVGGGYTTVTITPSNTHFGPFVFQVYVGDGSSSNPYVIANLSDMQKIGSDAKYKTSNSYVLTNDIDLSSITWTPVETFSGHFDGNGHTIYNLKVDSTSNGGLFGTIEKGGVVENVTFEKVAISGSFDYVGAVAGVNYGTVGKTQVLGTINNTKATGFAGLVVGANMFDGSGAYVNMCSAEGTITTPGNAGGLAGRNYSSIIINSRAIVNLNATGTAVGGLVGVNEGSVDDLGEPFYASGIYRSYAVAESVQGGSNAGCLVGENIDYKSLNSKYTNIFENVYYAKTQKVTSPAIGNQSDISALDVTFISNLDDLNNKETYSGFNFDSIWVAPDRNYAKINFLGAYETVYIRGTKKETLATEKSLIEFLNSIRGTDSEEVFVVDQNSTYDLANEYWQTIANDPSSPLLASIIVEDGFTCTIKNFKLSGANSSFFGYIGGNASINGIVFDNVKIDNTVTSNTAVVASGLYDMATLNYISVKNFEVKTEAKNVAVICAENKATITNCSVVSGTTQNKVTVFGQNEVVNFGNIAGYNSGFILGGRVGSVELSVNTSRTTSGTFNIGGAVGLTDSSITNCGVNGFSLASSSEGVMYVGGVVGNTTTSEISISNCYAIANIDLGIANDNAYLGGVVAYLSENSTLSGSLYSEGTLRAKNVAGIVGVNYGRATSCYSEGTIKGIIVAGLAVKNYKTIDNCYTLSTLNGETKASVVNGLVDLLAEGSNIDRCFSSATFSGLGSKYAETESPFRWNGITRAVKNFLAGDKYNYGTVTNCIIINYGKAEIQATSVFGGKGNWISASDSDCKGEGSYSFFNSKANFDKTIWNFDNVDSYPTLNDVAVVD